MGHFWNGIPYHYKRSFKEFYDLAAGNWDFKAKKGHVVSERPACLPLPLWAAPSSSPPRSSSPCGIPCLSPTWCCECGCGEAIHPLGVLLFAVPGSKSSVLAPRLSHFLQPLCPPPAPPPSVSCFPFYGVRGCVCSIPLVPMSTY